MALTNTPTTVAGKLSARLLIKPLVFVVCLLPLAAGVFNVATNPLMANPVEYLLHLTGEWGLKLLLITLCVTPLQISFKWLWVARLRRMLGLFAFFYALLHLVIWVVLEQELNIAAALREIVEKKYITIGIVSLLAMVPLAVTSNRWSIRKLGRRWKPLHRLIYPVTLLAIVHFLWQVRANDVLEPALHLGFLLLLLIWRFGRQVSKPGS